MRHRRKFNTFIRQSFRFPFENIIRIENTFKISAHWLKYYIILRTIFFKGWLKYYIILRTIFFKGTFASKTNWIKCFNFLNSFSTSKNIVLFELIFWLEILIYHQNLFLLLSLLVLILHQKLLLNAY